MFDQKLTKQFLQAISVSFVDDSGSVVSVVCVVVGTCSGGGGLLVEQTEEFSFGGCYFRSVGHLLRRAGLSKRRCSKGGVRAMYGTVRWHPGVVVTWVAVSPPCTDAFDGVQLVLVGLEELAAGGRYLAGVRHRDDSSTDAGGDIGGQLTHVRGLSVPMGVAAMGKNAEVMVTVGGTAIGGSAGGLIGGSRHHHCQNNL